MLRKTQPTRALSREIITLVLIQSISNETFFFLYIYIFFGVPHLATFILFLFIEYVIASIAYIHPVYGGIRTHNLLDVSLLP